jgi:GNAT superfamily N-acetyltransferase
MSLDPAQPASHPLIHIVPAQENDVPLILSFIRGIAEYERLSHEVVATEDLLRQSLFGEKPVAEVLIARYQDEPAGFAIFFQNYSTFLARAGLYLEDIFVWPRFRRNGIGRALLQRVARIAVERGCGRMEWAVLDWNQPAIEFYKGLGAVLLEEWTVFRLTGEALRSLGAPSATRG